MSNKTFLCVVRSEAGECEKPSPSDMEKAFAMFQAWQEKFADNILDMGGKLSSEGAVVRQESIVDGPFVELKEIIGGYMMLSAATLEDAAVVIKESPMVNNKGSSFEIREICKP
ncbi:YciI family protein [Agaribacter marinus]|uniref:YCII-related domain-containing protein n=1 Tax=Agaribacter marinus TaxID=1431249 RepID=A0AA37WH47_9ALTE|nr:YciI family protein [Agaribacter marinus]GLR69527.1 hypothetical protein GCM10007852_04350 [Agaribacter marinus]